MVQLGAVAIAHPVIAGEVRRGFRRCDHVIGRQSVLRVRQGNIDDLGPGIAQHGNTVLPQFIDLCGDAINAVFARDTDLFAPNVARQRGFEIGYGQFGRGAVFGVIPGHSAQHDCRVAYGFGHWPRLIQRRGKRHNAPAGTAPIGRLDPHSAGKGRRLADRSAGIGAGGRQTQVCGYSRGRPARRPAGGQRSVIAGPPPRVHSIAINGGFIRRAHREFIHVELTQHHRATIQQILRHSAFILGHEAFKDPRRGLRRHTFGAEQVLDADGQATHRRRIAGFDPRICRLGLIHRKITGVVHECIQRARALDGGQTCAG